MKILKFKSLNNLTGGGIYCSKLHKLRKICNSIACTISKNKSNTTFQELITMVEPLSSLLIKIIAQLDLTTFTDILSEICVSKEEIESAIKESNLSEYILSICSFNIKIILIKTNITMSFESDTIKYKLDTSQSISPNIFSSILQLDTPDLNPYYITLNEAEHTINNKLIELRNTFKTYIDKKLSTIYTFGQTDTLSDINLNIFYIIYELINSVKHWYDQFIIYKIKYGYSEISRYENKLYPQGISPVIPTYFTIGCNVYYELHDYYEKNMKQIIQNINTILTTSTSFNHDFKPPDANDIISMFRNILLFIHDNLFEKLNYMQIYKIKYKRGIYIINDHIYISFETPYNIIQIYNFVLKFEPTTDNKLLNYSIIYANKYVFNISHNISDKKYISNMDDLSISTPNSNIINYPMLTNKSNEQFKNINTRILIKKEATFHITKILYFNNIHSFFNKIINIINENFESKIKDDYLNSFFNTIFLQKTDY